MTDVERLQLVLEAKVGGYLRDLGRADRATEQTARTMDHSMGKAGKQMAKHGKHMGGTLSMVTQQWKMLGVMALAMAPAVAGAFVVGIGVSAVKAAAKYEQGLTNALSVTGLFGKELEVAKESADKLAKQLGRDTAFSAQEAAGAMYDLASKGYDVSTWAKTLPGILSLASATQSDLASTTELVTSTINQFNLEQAESARVADVFAKAIGSSAATQEKLALSMAYVGPVAATLGWTLEDTVATLSRLYDAGFKAEQAGTAMRMVMLSIQDPAGDAEAIMERFGITTETFSRDKMPGLIKQLQDGEATAGDVAAMFGKEAAPAVLALLKAAEDPKKSIDALDKTLENAGGTAEKVAKQQLDTLQGQWTLLQSSVEGAQIALGEIGSGALKDIVSDLIGPVNSVTEFLEGLDDIAGWEGADLTGKIKIGWGELTKDLEDWFNNPELDWSGFQLVVGQTGKEKIQETFLALGEFAGAAMMKGVGIVVGSGGGAEQGPQSIWGKMGEAAADSFWEGVKLGFGEGGLQGKMLDFLMGGSKVSKGEAGLSGIDEAILKKMGFDPDVIQAWVESKKPKYSHTGTYIGELVHGGTKEALEPLGDDVVDALYEGRTGIVITGDDHGDAYANSFKLGVEDAFGKWQPALPLDMWAVNAGRKGGSGFGTDLMAELQQMGNYPASGARGLTSHMAKLAGQVSGQFGVSMGSGFRPGATIRNTGKPSLHGRGQAGDFFGSERNLWAAFRFLAANASRLGIQEILYRSQAWSTGVPYAHLNTNKQSVRDHQDHLHVGTRYHTGGEVGAVLQVGERVLTSEQNSFLKDLSSSLRDLIDTIRANVNADKDVPVGGKGAAANEQILDLFGTNSARIDSYVTREGARLEMLKALRYDLSLQMATLERQADFLDRAVAEKAAQLSYAKERGMDPQVINEIATELFGLSAEAAGARDAAASLTEEMHALALVPLEQAAAGWSNALGQVNTIMSLLENSSQGSSQLFPQQMGLLGGQYQSALDLMAASTDPTATMQHGNQALGTLESMFTSSQSQLRKTLADTTGAVDVAQSEWEAAWQARGDALDREIAREDRSRQSALMQLQSDQRVELEALQAGYTERLALLDANYKGRLDLLDAQAQTVSRGRATGDLQGELDELISQEGKTEADIRRIHEIREQLSRLQEDYASQDARAGLMAEQERARAGLLAEQERALSELQERQESQRIAQEDQLQAQEASARLRREAHEQERIEQLAQFAALREQAQAAYQLEIDALVVKFQGMMEEVIAQENLLLGEAGVFSNAGQTLGLSFADGLQSAQANVAAAAAALAATAASYLELNSPAKMGPLSELDQWFVPFVPTLIEPLQPQSMATPASQVAGSMGTTTTRHLIIEGRGTLDESMLPIIVQAVKDNLRDEYDDVQWSYGR